MKVVEIFKSIEGEGIRTGAICTFVRLFGCNLRCVYCDSMYANEVCDEITLQDMTVDEIVQECIKNKTPYVTLTGGEPLIHKDIDFLIVKLMENGFHVNIETNGSVDIKEHRVKVYDALHQDRLDAVGRMQSFDAKGSLMFTIDYKVPYSGCQKDMLEENFTLNPQVHDVIKFVVANKEDLDLMKDIVSKLRKYCPLTSVFVSPVFGEIEPKEIVEYLKENDLYDIRMQLQIHKFIWPADMKGV